MTRAEMAQRGDGGESPKKRARVPNPPLQLDAAQQRRRAKMKAHIKKTVALERTMAVVDEHMRHTGAWNAVAEKYVDHVWLAGDVLLEKYPDLARKSDAPGEVDPWPENGLPFELVFEYISYYVAHTPGVLGYATVCFGSARNHMDLLYCAALRMCEWTADFEGKEALRQCRKNSRTTMSLVGGGTKEILTPVMRMLLASQPAEFQEDRTKKKAVEGVDVEWAIRLCHQSLHANRSMTVAAMISVASLLGLRPSSMFENKVRAKAAEAALGVGENETPVFRGLRLKHLKIMGWDDEEEMSRLKGKLSVHHFKGIVVGEVRKVVFDLYPGVSGSCITVDPMANIVAMLFRREVFKRQVPGMTPEQQYDAIMDNVDFTYKEGYGDRPLFAFTTTDGEVMEEKSHSTVSALAAMRSVLEPAGAEPLTSSFYNFRKYVAESITKSTTGGPQMAQTALTHRIKGDAIESYVRPGNVDTASLIKGRQQRQMLQTTSMQVSAIPVAQQATVNDPRVQALILADDGVATMEATMPPLEFRSRREKEKLWHKKRHVAEKMRVRVVRQQFQQKREDLARMAKWDAKQKCLRLYWDDADGKRQSKVLSSIPAVSDMTMREFVVSKAKENWVDESCTEIVGALAAVPEDISAHLIVHRLSNAEVHEMYDPMNSSVAKVGSLFRRTFDCAVCKRESVDFTKTTRMRDMWIHHVTKHRGLRKIFACKKCKFTTNHSTRAVKHVRKCLAKAKQREAKQKKAEDAVESRWDTTVGSTQEQSQRHSGEDSSDMELYLSESSYFSDSDDDDDGSTTVTVVARDNQDITTWPESPTWAMSVKLNPNSSNMELYLSQSSSFSESDDDDDGSTTVTVVARDNQDKCPRQ